MVGTLKPFRSKTRNPFRSKEQSLGAGSPTAMFLCASPGVMLVGADATRAGKASLGSCRPSFVFPPPAGYSHTEGKH